MVPKSLAVLIPSRLVSLFAVPLSASVRVLDPMQNALRAIEKVSLRVLWPRFKPEPDLRVADLERAVELSTDDASLLEHEQRVLQAIVSLADMRVDELMRPRTRFLSFRPPVALADLEGRMPPSGYLLVTEPNSDEVVSAIDLESLSNIPRQHLEHLAEPVVYVPWSTSVASALETMRARNRRVAVVVNELGETIGVFTFHDVLDTIFTHAPSRTQRLLKTMPIMQVGPEVWHVNGMTGLKRLSRYFGVERPKSWSVTVSGVVQEVLERLPEKGDRCTWGPFHFEVLDVPERGQLLVRLTLHSDSGELPAEKEDRR
jgi:CBS domain containing-hemolysin-like protein